MGRIKPNLLTCSSVSWLVLGQSAWWAVAGNPVSSLTARSPPDVTGLQALASFRVSSSYTITKLEFGTEHVSGAERWEFPLPAHVGFRSTAQSRSRPLRSIPLPAHLQFHPTLVKSLHARSNLKFLCMPNTCRFQPKPYAWDTLSAWRTWSGFVAWLLRKKSASLLFCRGAAVAVWLDRAPDTRVFRRQCGFSNLLT